MAIKAFNVDERVYKEFLEYCKREGISMSKKIENFFKAELEKTKLKQPSPKSSEAHALQGTNSFSKYCN